MAEKMMKNSLKTWNLLKVLNKDLNLEGLDSIEEVYGEQVNLLDEIIYYHKTGDKKLWTSPKKGQILESSLNLSIDQEKNPKFEDNNKEIFDSHYIRNEVENNHNNMSSSED